MLKIDLNLWSPRSYILTHTQLSTPAFEKGPCQVRRCQKRLAGITHAILSLSCQGFPILYDDGKGRDPSY